MANPEHLAELKKGAYFWNKWRMENPIINPDLSGANLYGADLPWADLTHANLSKANFTGALLNFTKFQVTELSGTDFTDAFIIETIFADVDLTNVIGLESCVHSGPSCVDHRTLIKSRNLPEVFLRGCGFPDSFIENLPSLIGAIQPIQFYSCFISYSSKDHEFARRLHADLQAKGVRCWFAPEDLKIGEKIRKGLDEAIRIHDKLLLILSENSVNSDWVEKEVETAFEKERKCKVESGKDETVLSPIRLDDTVMNIETGWPADIRRIRHIGDFTQWKEHDQYTESFDRLLKDLKASIEDKK